MRDTYRLQRPTWARKEQLVRGRHPPSGFDPSHDHLFCFDMRRRHRSSRTMGLQAQSAKPAVPEHASATPRPAVPMNRKAALFDVLAAAGIRINPEFPDPWDIRVKDENQFIRRIMSPLNSGLTALGTCTSRAFGLHGRFECLYRCLTAESIQKFVWCLPNIGQYWVAKLFNLQTKRKSGYTEHYDGGPSSRPR